MRRVASPRAELRHRHTTKLTTYKNTASYTVPQQYARYDGDDMSESKAAVRKS